MNNQSIHLLRGKHENIVNKYSETVLDDGQPLHDQCLNLLFVGDGKNKLCDLKPLSSPFQITKAENNSLEYTYYEDMQIKTDTIELSAKHHLPKFSEGILVAEGKNGISDLYIPTGTSSETLSIGSHTHNSLTNNTYVATLPNLHKNDTIVVQSNLDNTILQTKQEITQQIPHIEEINGYLVIFDNVYKNNILYSQLPEYTVTFYTEGKLATSQQLETVGNYLKYIPNISRTPCGYTVTKTSRYIDGLPVKNQLNEMITTDLEVLCVYNYELSYFGSPANNLRIYDYLNYEYPFSLYAEFWRLHDLTPENYFEAHQFGLPANEDETLCLLGDYTGKFFLRTPTWEEENYSIFPAGNLANVIQNTQWIDWGGTYDNMQIIGNIEEENIPINCLVSLIGTGDQNMFFISIKYRYREDGYVNYITNQENFFLCLTETTSFGPNTIHFTCDYNLATRFTLSNGNCLYEDTLLDNHLLITVADGQIGSGRVLGIDTDTYELTIGTSTISPLVIWELSSWSIN